MRKAASFFASLTLLLAAAGCNGYDKTDFTATANAASVVPPSAETATATMAITFNGPVAEWTITTSGTLTQNPGFIRLQDGAPGAASTGSYVILWDGPASSFTSSIKGSFIAETVTACATTPPAGTGVTQTTCVANRSYANAQNAIAGHTANFVFVGATGQQLIRGNF